MNFACKRFILNASHPLCLGLLAAIFAFLVAWQIFEFVPHIPDEHAYLFQAKIFAALKSSAPASPFWRYINIMYVFEFKHTIFTQYAPGFPLLLCLGWLLDIHWLVNSICSGLTVAILYSFARRLYGKRVAFWSAFFAMTSPTFLILGGSLMSHTSAMLFILLAFSLADKAMSFPRKSTALFAGLALGFAFSIRPFTVLWITFPLILFWILEVRHLARKQAIILSSLFACGCVATGLIHFAHNYILSGNPFTNLYSLYRSWDVPGIPISQGMGVFLFQLSTRVQNAFWDLWDVARYGMAMPFSNISFFALLFFFAGIFMPHRSIKEFKLFLIAGALVFGQLFYWLSGRGDFGPRYYAEILPYLWIICGLGVIKVQRALMVSNLTLNFILSLIVLLGIFSTTLPFLKQRINLQGATGAATRLMETTNLENAIVLVPDNWPSISSVFSLNNPFFNNSVLFLRDPGEAEYKNLLKLAPNKKLYFLDPVAEKPTFKPVQIEDRG